MNDQFSGKYYAQIAETYNRSEALVDEIENYGAKLQSLQLPILFSPLHLCLTMGIKQNTYDKVLKKRYGFYEEFSIRKKNGGFRHISAPKNDLLNYQNWVKIFILDPLQFPEYLTSYQKGKSIADNAKPHANQALLIKFDLRNFYGQITQDKVFGMFKILGYSTSVSVDLAKICCKPESAEIAGRNIPACLPQGAPTSPTISNFVAGRMDKRLMEYAKKHGFNYTRYADDLSFSGPLNSPLRKGVIERIIQDEGFEVNKKKTRFVPSSTNQLVTGLNVNHKAAVPKKFRRMVHTHLHNCLRFGPYRNLEQLGISDKINYNDWLLGHIHYIKILHPMEADKMMAKYNRINWIQ